MAETFVAIRGFPSYQISNHGRVISNVREPARFLTPSLTSAGYLIVKLYKDGKPKTFGIHRLIAMHFLDIPEDEDAMVVDHINLNKTDNRIENLRWATYSQNGLNRSVYGSIQPSRNGRKWFIQYTIPCGRRVKKSFEGNNSHFDAVEELWRIHFLYNRGV